MMFTQILLQRHEDQRAHQLPPRGPGRLQLLSSVWGPALSSQAGFPTTCRNLQIRQPAPSHLLNPCYSKWGPQTNSNSITWELVRHTLQTSWMTSGILTRSQVIPTHVTVWAALCYPAWFFVFRDTKSMCQSTDILWHFRHLNGPHSLFLVQALICPLYSFRHFVEPGKFALRT